MVLLIEAGYLRLATIFLPKYLIFNNHTYLTNLTTNFTLISLSINNSIKFFDDQTT